MFERQPIHQPTNRLQWLERLVSLFRVPSEKHEPTADSSPICETMMTEEPMSGQFCTHSRVQRWFAQARLRFFGSVLPNTAGDDLCPVCGLPVPESAQLESVLMVWFHDGQAYEFQFSSHKAADCYRIADNALHINLQDSVLSYSLDMISAVHFRKRYVPPAAPEVLAAERIIAGKYRQE